MSSKVAVKAENAADGGRFPAGMVVLLVYLSSDVVGRLAALVSPKSFLIGPYELPASVSVAYGVAEILALGFAGYGIVKRRRWGMTVAVTWLVLQIVYEVLNASLGLLHPQETLQRVSEIARQERFVFFGQTIGGTGTNPEAELAGVQFALVQNLVLIGILNGIAIAYLRRRRGFFRP